MAPRRKRKDDGKQAKAVSPASLRTTRSMTSRPRRSKANYSPALAPTVARTKKKNKKASTSGASKGKKVKESTSEKKEEDEEVEAAAEEEVKAEEKVPFEPLGEEESGVEKPDDKEEGEVAKKKRKTTAKEKKEAEKEVKVEKAEIKEREERKGNGEVTGASKEIIIEHCKQCNSFKTRANMVKQGLEEKVPGIAVVINPEKPRKGCLEIRDAEGQIFISLLDMKRPFKPMKDLDMDEVISDIVKKIQS